MDIDAGKLQRAFNDLTSKVNALMAITGGLAAQVYQAEGDQGLEKARARANKIASEFSRPGSVSVDKRVISSIFDNAKL